LALPAPDPAPDADLLRIPVGPGSIHVDRYGHGGTPIVLVHGFGTSSFLWRAVGPALALARHTAYAVDLFGYEGADHGLDAASEAMTPPWTRPAAIAGSRGPEGDRLAE
jgi:pimeloyl-ACP methyl ester carboxylesterase